MHVVGIQTQPVHHQAQGLDHRGGTAQVGAPALQVRQVGSNRIGDQARAHAGRRLAHGDHDVHAHIGMTGGQLLQALNVVQVLCAAHAEIQVDGVVHARRERAAHDGEHRRQARAAAHTQHRSGVLAAQVSRAQRAADANRRAHGQLIEHVFGDAATGHLADLELHLGVIGQTGHRVGTDVLGRELQGGVLARRKRQRLGQLDANLADVVRGLFDRHHGALDDACRVHHHLVHLGNLDGAGLAQHRLAGQHIALAIDGRTARFGPAVAHIALDHLAAAGAAAARHAAVGHRHTVGVQNLQQVLTTLEREVEVVRLYDEFHGRQFMTKL